VPTDIAVPMPDKQVQFHASLTAARSKWLPDALDSALADVDADELADEVKTYVPKEARTALQQLGIREERVFPLPCVLRASPHLIGYYRLVLGVSQKQFYTSATGLTPFKSMEVRGQLKEALDPRLHELCVGMAEAATDLIVRVGPTAEKRDIGDLQLLALGVQFDGAHRNKIGQDAVDDVYAAIRELVEDHIEQETERKIFVRNAAGRTVGILLASDPDIAIIEETAKGTLMAKVAIEVKGGLDGSNAYNRAGEAEKSHIKASGDGFRDFWTVIDTENTTTETVHNASPTTRSWFELREAQAKKGDSWNELRDRIYQEVGIPTPEEGE
jgi:hypothetical protein